MIEVSISIAHSRLVRYDAVIRAYPSASHFAVSFFFNRNSGDKSPSVIYFMGSYSKNDIATNGNTSCDGQSFIFLSQNRTHSVISELEAKLVYILP